MKIEQVKFIFHPACPFDQLPLSDLQKQYLSDLRSQSCIQMLVSRYLQMGWLVNFDELYGLIEMLVLKKWILNPEVVEYFKNLIIKKTTEQPAASASQRIEHQYSVEQLMLLPFFRSLNPAFSEFLIRSASVYQYTTDMLICRAGESVRDLYVLLSGQAAVYRVSGSQKQFVSVLSDSSVFGEGGFFLGAPRAADIIATQTSMVLVVPYNEEVLNKYLNKEKVEQVVQRFWVQHALSHSEFFKNFPSDSLDRLMFCGQIQNIKSGQILFKEGDLAQEAFVLIQGRLSVQKKLITINSLIQGAFFGEIAFLLNGGSRSATIIAERDTVVLAINRNEFFKMLSENLYLAKEIQRLAQRRAEADRTRATQPTRLK